MGSVLCSREHGCSPAENYWRKMSSSNLRPKWWQLYLTFPLLIALFVLDARLEISVRGHQAVQIGILLLVYGLVHLWLRANANALSKMDRSQPGMVTVIRIPPYELPETDKVKRPMFQLSGSEVKGVLSETYEMDYIDAEALPIDEVSQELKKE
jgi:hypothetical protein